MLVVVVTGARGHVGANLVRELLRRVRALMHRDERALVGLAIERVRGDVLDPRSLQDAFDGAEVAFHLAAVISIDGDRELGHAPRRVRETIADVFAWFEERGMLAHGLG